MGARDVLQEAMWFAKRNKGPIALRLVLEPLLAVAADYSFRQAGISAWACNVINLVVMLVSFLAIHYSRRLLVRSAG